MTGRLNGIYTYGEGKQFWDIKVYRKKMRTFNIELEAVDRILSKIVSSPAKYRRHIEIVRSLYKEILRGYPYEPTVNNIVNIRLAHLELAAKNYSRLERYLKKITGKTNEYDLLLMRARSAFMQSDFAKAEELFERCIQEYKHLRVGTMVYLKLLLDTKITFEMNEKEKLYFWNTYLNYSLETKKSFLSAGLKNLNFFNTITTKVKLNFFDLEDHDLTSLAALAQFKEMSVLSLNGNKRLSSLKELNNSAIRALKISGTKITSLEGIDLNALNKIELIGNNLNDLNIIKGCVELRIFHANKNNLKSIEALLPMKKLLTLEISDNELKELYPIDFSKLQEINLKGNNLTDITPLKKALELGLVNIRGNKVSSLDALSGLPDLISVVCSENPLKSLGAFAKNPPKTLFHDITLFDDQYIETLLANWSDEKHRYHKKNLEILVELKKGDKADLRKLAIKSNEHSYLPVPVLLNLKDAHAFAKKHGAHLISIVDIEENDPKLTDRMPYRLYWIGLEEANDEFKWSTGEFVDTDDVFKKKLIEAHIIDTMLSTLRTGGYLQAQTESFLLSLNGMSDTDINIWQRKPWDRERPAR